MNSNIKISIPHRSSLSIYLSYQKKQYFPKADTDPSLFHTKNQQFVLLYEQDIKKIFYKDFQLSIFKIKRLHRSTFHILYLVHTRKGKYIIKIFPSYLKRSALHFIIEEKVSRLSYEFGFFTPEIEIINLLRDIVPGDYIIYKFNDSKSLYDMTKIKKENENVFLHFGKSVGNIHKIRTKKFGLINPRNTIYDDSLCGLDNTWKEYILKNLDDHLRFCSENNIIGGDEYQKIGNIIRNSITKIKLENPVLLHGDLANHNVLNMNDRIIFIDWEDMLSGDPLYDIAFYCTGAYNHTHWVESFVNGYFGRLQKNAFTLPFWLYFVRISIMKAVIRNRMSSKNAKFCRSRILYGLKKLELLYN